MSNLEELTLEGYIDTDQLVDDVHVHFEHVKIFRAKLDSNAYFEHITFSDKLEEIEINLFASGFEEFPIFLNFIKRNKNVKRLQAVGEAAINNDDLKQLASAELTATEIVLHCRKDVQSETVIDFIGKSQQLNRLTLRFYVGWETRYSRPEELFAMNVRNHIENGWNIYTNATKNDLTGRFLFLERKW